MRCGALLRFHPPPSHARISVRGQRRPKRLGTWSMKTRRNQCLGQRPVHLLHTSILPSSSFFRHRSFSVPLFPFQFSSFPFASYSLCFSLLFRLTLLFINELFILLKYKYCYNLNVEINLNNTNIKIYSYCS